MHTCLLEIQPARRPAAYGSEMTASQGAAGGCPTQS